MMNLFLILFLVLVPNFTWASAPAPDCYRKAEGVTLNAIRDLIEDEPSELYMSSSAEAIDGKWDVTVYFSFKLRREGSLLTFVGEQSVDPAHCSRRIGFPKIHQVDPQLP